MTFRNCCYNYPFIRSRLVDWWTGDYTYTLATDWIEVQIETSTIGMRWEYEAAPFHSLFCCLKTLE